MCDPIRVQADNGKFPPMEGRSRSGIQTVENCSIVMETVSWPWTCLPTGFYSGDTETALHRGLHAEFDFYRSEL